MPDHSSQQATRDRQFLWRGSLLQSLGTLTKILSPLLTLGLARMFTPEQFGLFTSLQLFVYTLSRIGTLGLDRGLIRHIAQQKEETHSANKEFFNHDGLYESLRLSAWIAFLLWGMIALLVHSKRDLLLWLNIDNSNPQILTLCFLALIPYSLLLVISGALEGARKPHLRILLIHILSYSLGPLLAMLFQWLHPHELNMAWGFLAGNGIALAVAFVLLKKHFGFTSSGHTFSWFPSPDLLRYSLPIAGHELVAPLLARTDLWLILTLLGPKEAAVYAMMTMLVNALRSIRQGFDPLLIAVVGSQKQDRSQLPEAFTYVATMVNAIQFPIAWVLLWIPGEFLILAGKAYVMDIGALSLLLAGQMLLGILTLLGQTLVGAGYSSFPFKMSLITLALNALLNLVWIPRWGLFGAALSTTLSLLLQQSLHLIYIRFHLGWHLFQKEFRWPLLITILVATGTPLLQPHFITQPLAFRLTLAGAGLALWLIFLWKRRHHFKPPPQTRLSETAFKET